MDSWTKLRKFLGHVVFNESLNGPKIALNIMNEGQKRVEWQISIFASKNSPSNPSPSHPSMRNRTHWAILSGVWVCGRCTPDGGKEGVIVSQLKIINREYINS